LGLLRAIFSFWTLARDLFDPLQCNMMPQSERLRGLHAQYTEILNSVLGTRADLLFAVVRAHVDGIVACRREMVRDLFVQSLIQTELHVTRLHHARPLGRFARAIAALRAVR